MSIGTIPNLKLSTRLVRCDFIRLSYVQVQGQDSVAPAPQAGHIFISAESLVHDPIASISLHAPAKADLTSTSADFLTGQGGCGAAVQPACQAWRIEALRHSVSHSPAVLMAALPPALNVFVLAQQYGVYVQRASAGILAGTVVSVATVTALIVLLKTGRL